MGVLTRDDLLKSLAQKGPETRAAEAMTERFETGDPTEMLDPPLQRNSSPVRGPGALRLTPREQTDPWRSTRALMLGYRCNVECRSCLWGDHRSNDTTIDIEEACRWIDAARNAADIRLVGFSGGESFLYLRELRALAGYCWTQHQLPSAISTNCYWALSESKAGEILEPLRELGLQQLLLSVDDFHQEHIPLDRVGHALRAGRRLGIECTLQAIVTRTSRRIRDYLADLGIEEGPGVRATFLREQLQPRQAELFLKRSILNQEDAESLSAMVPV